MYLRDALWPLTYIITEVCVPHSPLSAGWRTRKAGGEIQYKKADLRTYVDFEEGPHQDHISVSLKTEDPGVPVSQAGKGVCQLKKRKQICPFFLPSWSIPFPK